MPSLRLIPRALVLALLGVLASLLVVPATTASAETLVLCRGFEKCNAKGLGNDGYEDHYRQMWWRMYSGHNCTNYAAYRMIRAGMSTERPWDGSGNASNWGVELADRTGQTPMVGAIAWWRGRNHVQYVERVIDANTIIVSEDHWGGDFNWARIRRTSGDWPTGFIRLRDVRIQNVQRPSVSGTPRLGEPLTISAGEWNPAGNFTYAWYADGARISGAGAATYTPTTADVGKRLSVRMWATRIGYLYGSAASEASAPVAPGEFSTTKVPTITGTAKVGSVLTATNGAWSPGPTAVAVQWRADGVPIPGATRWRLEPTPELVGKRLTVVVTPTRPGYRPQPTSSAPTQAVAPRNIVLTTAPRLSGKGHLGAVLEAHPGAWTPADGVTVRQQWLRDGVPIAGATARRYTTSVADLGRRVAVRISYTSPGYEPVARTLALKYRVKTIPRISAGSWARRTITVRLDAPGVDEVRGYVRLIAPNGTYATGRLRSGKVTFSPSWLRVGVRDYGIRYLGTSTVRWAHLQKAIDVRR